MIRRLLRVACLACAALSTFPAQAEDPVVRVAIEPERVRVGEPVALEVQVLVPTYFTGTARFPSFELANAITRLPPDSTRPSSGRVDGSTWAGITRRYEIHALLGARFVFEGLEMQVSWYDSASGGPRTATVAVPPAEFVAGVPAGAEGLAPYLAGRSLVVSRELEGEVDGLAAGDALVARYGVELDGLPAIFLPPLVTAGEEEGVALYVDGVEVRGGEGGEPASRSERATFVFESDGVYRIPGLDLAWWNTELGMVEHARVEPLDVVVGVGAVAAETAVAPAERPATRTRVMLLVALLAVAGALLMLFARLRPRIEARLAERRARHLASEAHAWARLRAALRARDARAVHEAALPWAGRFSGARDLRDFAARSGVAELETAIDRFLRARFQTGAPPPDFVALERALEVARDGRAHRSAAPVLPALNP